MWIFPINLVCFIILYDSCVLQWFSSALVTTRLVPVQPWTFAVCHSPPGVGFSHVFLHYSPKVVLWTSGVSWWSSSMKWNIIPRWYDDVHQFWRAVEISQTPFWMHPSIITPCVHHATTHLLLLTVFLTFFRKTNTTCQCRVKTRGCHPGDARHVSDTHFDK